MHPPGQELTIFTFSGAVKGYPSAYRTCFARARSHDHVVKAMDSFGFDVAAVTSVEELRGTVQVMQCIAARDPDIAASDFIDLLGSAAPAHDTQAFLISGTRANANAMSGMLSGFALAPGETEARAQLEELGLIIHSILSLQQARDLLQKMEDIESGGEHHVLVDLEDASVAAI